MLNKFLNIFLVFFLIIAISNICYATGDVVMDLNNNINSTTGTVDNTLYGGAIDTSNNENTDPLEDSVSDISVTNDYDVSSSDELSVSNAINIILIVVGIVLVLLGIAIILKLK